MERSKYVMSNYESYNVDIYCQDEKVNVPFSWEYKPGLSKVSQQLSTRRSSNLVLQPPPYRRRPSSTSGGNKIGDEEDTIWGPLICAVQSASSLRISSFRIMESPKEEDPFIEAYKNCTRSPLVLKRSHRSTQRNSGYWAGIIMKYMHILSCKYSADVMSMVYRVNRKAVRGS